MSFSLSFVVAIASNVLVPIRSLFALPSLPLHPLVLLLSSYFVAPKFAATSNGKCSSKSSNACQPACPPACLCVCLLACSRYSYIYSFAQCFCSLFVCATSCLSPAPLSLSPSPLRRTFRSVSCFVLSPVGLLPPPSTPCIPLCLSGHNKCLTAAKSTATSTSTPTPTAITIPMPMSILIPIPFDLALEELTPLCIIYIIIII